MCSVTGRFLNASSFGSIDYFILWGKRSEKTLSEVSQIFFVVLYVFLTVQRYRILNILTVYIDSCAPSCHSIVSTQSFLLLILKLPVGGDRQ